MDFIIFGGIFLAIYSIYIVYSSGKIYRYLHRKKHCTKVIQASVTKADTVREAMFHHAANYWQVHSYLALGRIYYNKEARHAHAFPIGSEVSLYINPQNPEEFYQPQEQPPRYSELALAIAFFAFFLLVYIFHITNLVDI